MPFSTVSLSELMNTQRALKAALISPLAISPIILIGAIINLIEQSFDMGILVVIIFFSLGALIEVFPNFWTGRLGVIFTRFKRHFAALGQYHIFDLALLLAFDVCAHDCKNQSIDQVSASHGTLTHRR